MGAIGTASTVEFHEHEVTKDVLLKYGDTTYSIRMSKAGGTSVWVYLNEFSAKQMFHIRYAKRGELLDVRTMRPVRNNAHVKIGERVIFSTPDDRLVQIIVTGVLDYGAGDEKDEVRLKYQVHQPSEFLVAAL